MKERFTRRMNRDSAMKVRKAPTRRTPQATKIEIGNEVKVFFSGFVIVSDL
jgi:hypothetical protein